jgi:LacI family transcriptional regulator
MRPPTLKTLARQLGLSVTTVSRALKDGPEVRPETTARVKAAAAGLGYRPDQRAVNLRTGRTGVVAVLFWAPHVDDDVGDGSITSIVAGVCRRLEGAPYTPMVQLLLPGMEGLDRVRRIVEGRLADGMILSGTRPQDERVRYMLERRFPFVTFGRTELFTPHPWYDIDNELAARQATGHLAGLGHRRIALLDPPRELTFAQHRLLGYRRALAEAGLPYDPALVVNGGLGAAESRAATRRLCAARRPPTGIVCATGVVAAGVLAGLRDAGLAPGRDMAVVSRDGTRLADYLDPPLPTCFASLSDTGWHLCDLLLRAIGGAPPEELQRLVPTRLILPAEQEPAAGIGLHALAEPRSA